MSKQKDNILNCPCDERVHPPKLEISAGLSRLPRQIATFPEFRTAMLAAIVTKYPLRDWQARKEDDFGVMILEMWAYICDSLSFYDKVIAQETYLRTAQERESLSEIIQLLGYLPRPAIGAKAYLAAIAEGRRPVLLPKGLAFRSGPFAEETPQIFELDKATRINPFTNKWTIQPTPSPFLKKKKHSKLSIKIQSEVKLDQVLLLAHLDALADPQSLVIKSISKNFDLEQTLYIDLFFYNSVKLPKKTLIEKLRLYTPTQTTSLWTISGNSVITKNNKTTLVLNKVYEQIKPGQHILVSRLGEYRAFKISKVSQAMRNPTPDDSLKINGFTFKISSLRIPVTSIQLDTSMNDSNRKRSSTNTGDWSNSHISELEVHFEMINVGKIINVPANYITAQDNIKLKQPLEASIDSQLIRTFLLEDINEDGAKVKGRLSIANNNLILNQGETWTPPLQLPISAFGNSLEISRGETVPSEMFGIGDATIANQKFKLQKKPLTYFLAPETDSGVVNTLKVFVDGIRWHEVPNFFGRTASDEIYTVRQDEEGNFYIIFGDGIRGKRLDTGSQIMGTYRFGAGKASPPSGSINQIATPFEKLQSVHNPLPAYGGAEAESSEELRSTAPKSTLILGRAVSILDMEAVAKSIPGVLRAQSEWRWDNQKQRPVVTIWYIGEDNLEPIISARLRSVSDPNTPFKVFKANSKIVNLSINVQINKRFIGQQVLEEIRNYLIYQKNGLLRRENQAIGFPFYRSQLFKEILVIPGTVAVSTIFWNKKPFSVFAHRPKAGHYFDFENGKLLLSQQKIDDL